MRKPRTTSKVPKREREAFAKRKAKEQAGKSKQREDVYSLLWQDPAFVALDEERSKAWRRFVEAQAGAYSVGERWKDAYRTKAAQADREHSAILKRITAMEAAAFAAAGLLY